jgi:hypothetical protein
MSTAAFAQETPPKQKKDGHHQANREQKFAAASKRLNLTGQQQTQLKEILEANKTEMKALRETHKDASNEEKRALMIGQLKKADGKIVAILDAKQLETYKLMKVEKKKELQAKRDEKMKEREEIEEYQGIF